MFLINPEVSVVEDRTPGVQSTVAGWMGAGK